MSVGERDIFAFLMVLADQVLSSVLWFNPAILHTCIKSKGISGAQEVLVSCIL